MGVQEYHANQFLKENKKKYGISNVTYTNRIMYLNALHVKNMNCICASRLKQNVIYVIICNWEVKSDVIKNQISTFKKVNS